MRKSIGGILIVFVSAILIAGLAVFGQQREQSMLEAQSERYASRSSAGQPIANAQSSSKAGKQTVKSQIGHNRSLTYFAMGDDIAAGHYTSTEKRSYQYLVADSLHKKLGFKVRMTGVWRSGATIGTGGLPNVNRAIAQHPDVVTLQYGNNEQLVAGSSATLFQSNLTEVVRNLREGLPKVKIILITPWTQSASYQQAVVNVSKNTGTAVVNISPVHGEKNTSATASTNSWAGAVSGRWPNDSGNTKIASAIDRVVTKLYE